MSSHSNRTCGCRACKQGVLYQSLLLLLLCQGLEATALLAESDVSQTTPALSTPPTTTPLVSNVSGNASANVAAEEESHEATLLLPDCSDSHFDWQFGKQAISFLIMDLAFCGVVASVAYYGAEFTRKQVREVFCNRAAGSLVGMAWKQGITTIFIAATFGMILERRDPQSSDQYPTHVSQVFVLLVAMLQYFLATFFVVLLQEALRNMSGGAVESEKRDIVVNGLGYIPAWMFKDVVSSFINVGQTEVCGARVCTSIFAMLTMLFALTLSFVMPAGEQSGMFSKYRTLVHSSKALGVGFAFNSAITAYFSTEASFGPFIFAPLITVAAILIMPKLKHQEEESGDWHGRREFFGLSYSSTILAVAWAWDGLTGEIFLWIIQHNGLDPCKAGYLRMITRSTLLSSFGLLLVAGTSWFVIGEMRRELLQKVVAYNVAWAWMDVFTAMTGNQGDSVSAGLLRLWFSILCLTAVVATLGAQLLWLIEEGDRRGSQGCQSCAFFFHSPWFTFLLDGTQPTRDVPGTGLKQDAEDEEDAEEAME